MPMYRTTSSNFVHSNGPANFFHTMESCVDVCVREGKLKLVKLSPDIDPYDGDNSTNSTNYHRQENLSRWERDCLILRDGFPLLSLFMRYDKSGGPVGVGPEPEYVEALGYQGVCHIPTDDLAGMASLRDMKRDLGARLAAEMPKHEKPKEVIKPTFKEGRWTIVIRVPGTDPEVFQGEPMGFDGLDKAFDRLVDVLVARAPKPVTA